MVAEGMETYCATVLRAFKERGLATDAEVGAAGGPSTSTMTKLRERSLASSGPRGDVHRKVDTAAGWPVGTSRYLWETGELPVAQTYVAAPGLPAEGSEDIAAAMREMAEAIREMGERIARLEGRPGADR